MSRDERAELHALLSQFEDWYARRYEPANWNRPELDAVREVMQLIEGL